MVTLPGTLASVIFLHNTYSLTAQLEAPARKKPKHTRFAPVMNAFCRGDDLIPLYLLCQSCRQANGFKQSQPDARPHKIEKAAAISTPVQFKARLPQIVSPRRIVVFYK